MTEKKHVPGKMTKAEITALMLTSVLIVAVTGYTFYWLALRPPEAEFVYVLDAHEWTEYSRHLYEKYYPNPPPEDEWFTIVIPANVWTELQIVREAEEEHAHDHGGVEVGPHYFTSPQLPGVAGLILPGSKITVGVIKLKPGQVAQIQCGEYCSPWHDYMSYARIIGKEPRIIKIHIWMHQFFFDIHSPEEPHKLDPRTPWRSPGPQDALRGEDFVLIEGELGDIVEITLHATFEHEPEFEVMTLGSLKLGFEKEVSKGSTTTFQIRLNKLGEFDLYCVNPCGEGHELMKAKLVVKPPKIVHEEHEDRKEHEEHEHGG